MNKCLFRKLTLALCTTFALTGCGSNDNNSAQVKEEASQPVFLRAPMLSFTAPGQSLDLNNYTLVGQYNLPKSDDPANVLASEASAVTYNWDTDTLFVLGDGSTSIVQVDKQGKLIDSMALPSNPNGTKGFHFYDTEGLAYVGNGQFVFIEERDRQVNLFTYIPHTTLDPNAVKTVKVGTTIGNIGLEGVSYDRISGEYILAKEKAPMGLFQTSLNFENGSASNGSATTQDSVNLFDPALIAVSGRGTVADLGDVYALSNVVPASRPDAQHLLVLSEESGQLLKMDRQGKVYSTRDVEIAPLHAQIEGVALDKDLNLYLANEQGASGMAGNPQLWVYAPTHSAKAVGIGSHLYLQFGTQVVAGTGNIELRTDSGHAFFIPVTDTEQVQCNGDLVTINPGTDLLEGETYTIIFAEGVFHRASGEEPGIAAETEALKFTTVSTEGPPKLLSSLPVKNASNVATDSKMTFFFNKAVAAGRGSIFISNGTDDVRTVAANSSQVSIVGGEVSIQPDLELKQGVTYSVRFDASALTYKKGNAIEGLADILDLSFTTVGATPPTLLVAGDLFFLAAVAQGNPDDMFAFMLMRDVSVGTAIDFSDRDSLEATNEGVYRWTANQNFPAGTIVTVRSGVPVADKGEMIGAGGGLGKGETIFAFQGTVSGLGAGSPVIEKVDRYISAINFGGKFSKIAINAVLQTALESVEGAFLVFPELNVKYDGTTSVDAVKQHVADTNNWLKDSLDTSVFVTDSNGSLFP